MWPSPLALQRWTQMHIGLFGGSFNPPHIGHSLLCFYLLETSPLEEIWLLPTYQHAFGKPLAPFEQRLELCRLLAGGFGGRVRVNDLERSSGPVSYTIDTVRTVLAAHPDHTFEWIIGADILQETGRWKDFDHLCRLVTLRVVGRDGYSGGGPVDMPALSSSLIRARLEQGLSVEGMLPSAVRRYLETHPELYHRRVVPPESPAPPEPGARAGDLPDSTA